ncbi:hypothetical protein ACT9XH_02270 [Methanococcoides methylutens]|uniref:hypothetical protein n=1 Tax=Methanococcoides methylutens TaxID=2226 RepID=UPI004043ABB6
MTSVLKICIGLAIVIILLTTVTTIDKDNTLDSLGAMVGSAQPEIPNIEENLMSELTETPLDSGVNVVGISYYEDIDAIVIGLEKKTYSNNEHLRNSMVSSIFEIMPIVLDHHEELGGKKIVFTGSSIALNARGSQTMMKIFHTEIQFDVASQIDWNGYTDHGSKEQLLTDHFEYVWWHAKIKSD